MANGFKTPAGVFVISGLHVLPIWVFGHRLSIWRTAPAYAWFYTAGLLVLLAGRVWCACIEVYCIADHIVAMVRTDEESMLRKSSTKKAA
jgi:hypothetical protein